MIDNWKGSVDETDRRLKHREPWTSREWAMTIAFLFVFPPIGIAALLRRLFYRRVWLPFPKENTNE